MESELHPTPTTENNARKRMRCVSKREKQKINRQKKNFILYDSNFMDYFRHSMKESPEKPCCRHGRGSLKCTQITEADAISFAKGFYSTTSKILQDCFLLKYCSGYSPQRRDRRFGGPEQIIRIDYNIRKENGKMVKVCKKAFFKILKISEFRVKRVCKHHLATGNVPKENRGGNRKAVEFKEKKLAVIAFIQTFKIIEIHYCRDQIKHREYLPQELNIKKMAKMFNDQTTDNMRVKTSFFRKIFNTNFNIGFKCPAKDLCSTCIMYTENINHCKVERTKNELIAKKRVHKLRAKAFFSALKEERPGVKTLSFDCQKNQLLPKVEDQAAYRCRQLYQNNFGVVEGSSKSRLTKENVFLYQWTENVRPKGSNEIASAVYHRLNNTNFTGIWKVRLFADACGGQNKNSILVAMCAYWLQEKSPKNLTELELIFPVAGHSFMPPDRVFAVIENDIKTKQSIIDPREYVEIFEKFGTVIDLGYAGCRVYDWKNEAKTHFKAPGQLHFKFNPSKRFILKKEPSKKDILIRGEPFYKTDIGEFKSFVKRKQSISDMKPKILATGVNVNPEKLKDVNDLLKKHFGKSWKNMELENLNFYKNCLSSVVDRIENKEDDPTCESFPEDADDLRV